MAGPKNSAAADAAKDQALVNTAAAIVTNATADPTPAQIEAWKVKHKEVFLITVESGEKCWLRKPTRLDLGAAQAAAKKNPLKFNESLLANCWLDGDPLIKTDDDLFFAASQVLDEVLVFKTATATKL